MSVGLQLSMKPAARAKRAQEIQTSDIRMAATLDDIATALELIVVQLERVASK